MTQHASAFPHKRFFLEMFTRDISVEDCILDLIDNSVDALIRTRNIQVSSLLRNGRPTKGKATRIPTVEFTHSPNQVAVIDNCGGIPNDLVLNDVFSFGHTPEYELGALGAYGVGLKRALFKLGRHFVLESRTPTGGFRVSLDVEKWSLKDSSPEDWYIPVSFIEGVGHEVDAGTSIRITHLRPEVIQRFRDPMTLKRLHDLVGQAYALFLGKHVRAFVDAKAVEPLTVPLGESSEVNAGVDEFAKGGVKVTLLTSLAPRDDQGEWLQDKAGWYVFCNGRLVVAADKSDLTGWGIPPLPAWHSKYRGFVGMALFQSDDPLALPWTTTKRDLNRESPIYQYARERMAILARPVMTFLNRMYPSEPQEVPADRRIADRVKPISISQVAARKSGPFVAKQTPTGEQLATVRVQYDATKEELDRIRRRLGKTRMSATRIGRHTLDYFLKRECPR